LRFGDRWGAVDLANGLVRISGDYQGAQSIDATTGEIG
jgi:hypothetical protein